MKFRAAMCRVYFNRAADAPKVYSVDFGAGTAEICCARVLFDAPGETKYAPELGDGEGPRGADVKTPRAWIEFDAVEIEILASGAVAIRREALVSAGPHGGTTGAYAATTGLPILTRPEGSGGWDWR